MKKNRIYLSVDTTDLQEINNAIAILIEKLPPYLDEITNLEKLRMAKMKDKSFAFVQKAYEYSLQNPYMIPTFVDPAEFKKEIETMELFRQLAIPLKKLNKGLDDTNFLMSSDAYNTALNMYQLVKTAAKNNVAGASVVYDDLKIRFEYQGPGKSKPNTDKAA